MSSEKWLLKKFEMQVTCYLQLHFFPFLGKLCITRFFVCRVSGQPEKIQGMKQAALDLKLSVKKTRKREFLEQMEHVVPWAALVALIAPYYPEGRTGRPPFALETMLSIHFLQQLAQPVEPGDGRSLF